MALLKRKAFIDTRFCVACGTCLKVCPFKIIKINKDIVAEIDTKKCIACGKCAKACPASIIEIKQMEVND
ncbi:4Fe-4S dicluster domain-containing protein [Romboutsia ilealis]|uniref:Ferredoxin n=1 Tax=Romboutsia faecis TaxID=2764597 RepID=A0ABR7JMS4_9FIRM|nr:4Fe-4S dicluster domain-containing protein [Romboutsia faecis]MBC5996223.1 4Fe-4S dicluster domain-containing protein [Romboutsia faecis]MRN25134.1 4Fe-4S dicluster domain-containing protein [Romboutsia ilealis]